MKTIGIIGGMGPLATVNLFENIITMTEAKSDNEHIPILIDNNTQIPDRTSFILGNGENPIFELVKSAKRLEKMGSDFLVMPCNTAHYFYNEVDKSVNIEVINMIEETAKYILRKNIKKVGLLSTTGTIKAKIYEDILKKYDIDTVIPIENEQDILMKLIYGIKEGKKEFDVECIKAILNNFKKQGCTGIILGCTELPIAIKLLGVEDEFINPTSILASVSVEKANQKVKA